MSRFAPSTTSVLRPTTTSSPFARSGAYQVQRAGYYDNPNVYTGRPTTNLPSTLRGRFPTAATIGGINQFPAYQSNYAAAQVASPGLPLSVTTPQGAPVTALPTTQIASPFTPTQVQPRVGGLGRFFGSLFGTNYRSSYYRAPVTYYRPVTSVDPVTGTTVTVQQPCTAYTQQLQRSPYSSLQVAQPQPSTCSSPQSYIPQGYAPQGFGPVSGVGQVGAIAAPGQFTVPIPSTAPSSPGFNQAFTPNTMPLTGTPQTRSPSPFDAPQSAAPLSAGPMNQPPSSSDLSPVDQPRIENRPSLTPPGNATPPPPPTLTPSTTKSAPESYWQLQDADNSTAMIRSRTLPVETRPMAPPTISAPTMNDPVSLTTERQLDPVRPIRTHEDYVSPFRRPSFQTPQPSVSANEELQLEAPPLPARSIYDPSDATSVSNRVSVPFREAGLVRSRTQTRRPKPAKRDNTWNSIP